ncbi:hypothetical protein NHJ13051_006659 [Beauveria bassiana]
MEASTPSSRSAISLHQRRLSESELSESGLNQAECPLFKFLPAEIRSHIFALALVDYEEPAAAHQYARNTCWARPSYSSPRRTDTALLRTCKYINRETWFLPFLLKEQTHWITARDRAPPEYSVDDSLVNLRQAIAKIKRQHNQSDVEIRSFRVFTQMYKIEAHEVTGFLSLVPYLSFQRLCITIRHADFWFWENDAPLRFESQWIPRLCAVLPSAVREVVIEMETVSRKAAQLDEIAKQMAQKWHFRIRGEERLFADSTPNGHEVCRWRGSSSWHNQRWIRDEISDGTIEYYVGAVRFQPRHAIEKAGGKVSDEALQAAASVTFMVPEKLHLPDAEPMQCVQAYVPTDTEDLSAVVTFAAEEDATARNMA